MALRTLFRSKRVPEASLQTGEPLAFVITFVLKRGEKDSPCPPLDTEPA